jgi:hypothetical protein
MADENVKPTDGSTKQWDKLQKMRRASGTALTNDDGTPAGAAAAEPGNDTARATAEQIAEEQRRLQAGEPVGGAEPPAEADDDDDDDETDDEPDGEDETPEPEKVVVKEHERTKPAAKVAAPKPRPGFEFIEMDGKQVEVDASLAQAFREAESAKVTAATVAKDDQLVDKIVERVTAKLPPAPTPADAVAAKPVVDEPFKHPMPSQKLAIENPEEYDKQLADHIEEKTERKAAKAIAEKEARDAAAAQTQAAATSQQQIAWAKEQLGIQFYRQFKVLDDPAVKPLVDVLLNKKFDEVIASGQFAKPVPPKEAEAAKLAAFNAVAAEATRSIVKLRGTATPSASAETPPRVVTGSAGRGPKAKPTPPPEKPREKFPTGSVSSMLKAHQDKKAGRGAGA